MKYRNTLYHCLVILWLGLMIYGCGSYREVPVTENTADSELSDNQKREYNYALTEATKQKVFGNLRQAITLYKKCLEVNPASDVAFYQLGILYMSAGNTREAIDYTLKAVELNKQNYWYYLQLASLYMMNQKRDSAIIVYKKLNTLEPGDNAVRFDLAVNYAETERYDQALELLDMIESEIGVSEKVSMVKERIYATSGNFESAISEVMKLMETGPDEIRYIGILAELYGAAGMDENAMDCYKRIFEMEPDNGLAQLSMADYYKRKGDMVLHYEKISEAFKNNMINVEKKLEILIMKLSDQIEITKHENEIENLIKVLLMKYPDEHRSKMIYGDFLVKSGRYNEAVEQFEEVLPEQKSNYFIWEQLVFLYSTIEDTEKVYKTCLEAIKLFPERPVLYLFKGNVESIKGEFDEGLKSFEKGIKLAENNIEMKVQFLSFMAESYRNLGNHQNSDDCFQEALEIQPDNLVLLNNYSYYLALRNERLNEAEKMSRSTLTAESQNHTYLDTYAWVLYKMGKYRKALEYIELTVKYGGAEDADILEHYGDILMALGRKLEAVEYWKQAIRFGGQEEYLNNKINMKEK